MVKSPEQKTISSVCFVAAAVQDLKRCSRFPGSELDKIPPEPDLRSALFLAGKRLCEDVKKAITDKQPVLEISRGVYRLNEAPIEILGADTLTLRGPGVEIICEQGVAVNMRILWNKNIVIEGELAIPFYFYSLLIQPLWAKQRLQAIWGDLRTLDTHTRMESAWQLNRVFFSMSQRT